MIAFPNAKINLGLHVVNKRADGFHNIETVFYPIPLCDALEVIETNGAQKAHGGFTLQHEGLKLESPPAENLVTRAYHLLKDDFRLPPVTCFLHKKIPMGAGLGGGSANAAFMLGLLNRKFNTGLTNDQLKVYAAQLGSDCAFFIDNTPAYAFGKGHELQPVSVNLSGTYLVLINPGIPSSTAAAYQHVTPGGKQDESLSVKEMIKLPMEAWKEYLVNDFEQSVFTRIPQLAEIKKQLYACGAGYAAMSGSGSVIYGLFPAEPDLPEALKTRVCYQGPLT